MKTALFDFELPESSIAHRPASPRDAARLLVINEKLRDAAIRDLPQFFRPGDVLVMNDTRVIPARLLGRRGEAKVEVLLHRLKPSPLEGEGGAKRRVGGILSTDRKDTPPPNSLPQGEGEYWICFAKPAKRLKAGDRIGFADDFYATVKDKMPDGQVLLAFNVSEKEFYSRLERHGHMPLPPYIARPDDRADRQTYQTIYARHEGSVAAPTAGLHFTEALLKAIDDAGVKRVAVTLHVGGGTFLPVKAEDTNDHVMHSEYGVISEEAAAAVNAAKQQGGRVIAIGTTSLRTLESAADEAGRLRPFSGETDIFITPGYRFKLVDILLTNFHLPRSTLFMLACAFAGTERMKAAYAHAIASGYRFYSYGDACLLYRQS